MLVEETLEKDRARGLSMAATTIPDDLKFFVDKNVQKLSDILDPLFLQLQTLQRNLQDYMESLQMDSKFYK